MKTMTINNRLKQCLILLAAVLLVIGSVPVGAVIQGGQQAATQPSNTLTIKSTADERAFYEFTVSGQLEYGANANPVDDPSNPTHPDKVTETTASGTVAENGNDTYRFSGEIRAFKLTEGPADVFVNGEQINPGTFPDVVTATSTEPSSPTVDAKIVNYATEKGTFQVGETQTAKVTVKNTGDQEHTFFVGYIAIDPNGDLWNNDDTTGTTATLAPGEQKTVSVGWTVEAEAPVGNYGVGTAIWKETDDLETRLDEVRRSSVFSVERKTSASAPGTTAVDTPTATTVASDSTTDRETETNPPTVSATEATPTESSPPPASAESINADQFLLDSEKEDVESVRVEGQVYKVYRQENMLPYASGIEIYTNGERVTSEETARAVIQKVAWQRATSKMGSDDIETLRQLNQSTTTINKVITPPLEALNYILGFIDDLKEQGVWSVATNLSPQLSAFETSARELRNGLQGWKEAADQVNQNVPLLINDLERMKRGEDVNYDKVSSHYSATVTGLDQLQSRSANVSDRLATVSEAAGTVSSDVSGIPGVGEDFSKGLTELSATLGDASSQVDEFSSDLGQTQSKLSSVRSSAESTESEMMSAWNTRQTAEMKVYGTLGGGGLVGVVVLGSLIRRL
jgi:ABC-type transporter Mla subunit MlaD